MKITKGLILKASALLLAIIAIFMGLAAGFSKTATVFDTEVTSKYQLFGMMFGSWNDMNGNVGEGPLALAGLLAFIFIILAIVAIALSVVLKDNAKLLTIIGAGLLVLSAIFMFLLLAFGCDKTITTSTLLGDVTTTLKYADYVKDAALGAGAWLWSIFALIGAGALGATFIIKD